MMSCVRSSANNVNKCNQKFRQTEVVAAVVFSLAIWLGLPLRQAGVCRGSLPSSFHPLHEKNAGAHKIIANTSEELQWHRNTKSEKKTT
jgi:hypothetical protein